MLIIRLIVLLVLNSSFGSSFISADTCSTISGSTETISTNCGPIEISGDGSNVTINSGVTIEHKNTTVKTPNATNAVITNNGTIKTSEGSSALRNTLPGDISDLTNNGLITATANDGIRNGGTIDNLTNSGQISANRYGIRNLAGNGRLIGTLANSGEISAIDHSGIKNDGIIETLNNSGEIKAKNQGIWTKGTITTLTNSGTISAENTHAIKIVPGATIGTITNSGTISAGGDFAIRNDESDINSNIISKISNSGIISANRNGIWNDATITSLTNSGTIRTINQDFAIKNVRGTIGTLTNSGSITAGRDWAIYNDATATISRLTNTGIISSSNNNIGIYNHGGTITTLDNDQSTLTYRGALPTNYKAIINSPSDYGKITFSDVSGTTNFGVHSSSILTEATYNSVISGITSGDIASGTSGKHSNPNACNDVNGTVASFSSNCADLDISGNNADVTINSGVTISGEGDLDWELDNSSGTLWDLVVTDELHQIQNTGYNNALTNLGIIAATENSSNAINNEESFATIINNGTISSNGSHAIHNNTSASITTLTNSGVISSTNNNAINNIGLLSSITNTGTISGGDYGINNTGTIGYILNTGSISDGNNIGIINDGGTITTLDNSQSDLTYKGVLPTNYNAIISGPSDYGKIIFSDASGAINFGVHASSTLAVGTYDSVMSGLSSSNLITTSGTVASPDACNDVNGTVASFSSNCADLDISGNNADVTINSGVTISGEGDLDWVVNNSSGTLWDLVVIDELHQIENTGYNNALTNLGVIAATENSSNAINNKASFATIINNGTISSNGSHAIHNNTSAAITSLTNTGTISGGDYGINNTGAIGYISNTGTISAGNNIGIYNHGGTITTLDNYQSTLTYKGVLPTNYNAIINSPSDYGKITFSDVSGATNFGVHASSTIAVGTYDSVMSGLNTNNVMSGTSGTFVSGADRINWTLENSGSIWNLVIADKIDITPDTNISIKTSVKTNTIDTFNDLNSVIEVNFANMNTYDCDSFGRRNGCLSIGGRNTQINNPKTGTNAIVLIGGYKLSDSFRVAGFYHRNYEHDTPKRFKLSDKTPLLGTLIVWNQFTNGLGLQIKLATAFQKKYATLIREVIGSSEEGRATTEISTKSKVIEFQQGYRFNNDIILRPYLAFRKAVSQQDAYDETGIESPLSFNAIRDEMITALFGLKFDIDQFGNLPEELSFRGSMGIEYDLTHSVSKIKPEGISGLTTVSLTESFNEKRPVVSLGFDYEIKANRKFSGTTQYQELPYENKNETNYYLYYTQGF